jgi:hypothetical protein
MSGQLVGTERLLTERCDSRAPSGQIEIGKMAGWVGHDCSVRNEDLDLLIFTLT